MLQSCKVLYEDPVKADHMTRGAAWTFLREQKRNAETWVLRATHQLITVPFYQAYPHSVNNAAGRTVI